jgi:hypothetical protein
MTESKSMFMTVILPILPIQANIILCCTFTLYNMSDGRYEKPVAYKFICLVCEPLPVLLKNLINNVHYNFSVTELPALFIWDQKILSTCIEWNILTSDQLTFISWLLGILAFSLSNLCHRVTSKPHPKNTEHFLNHASWNKWGKRQDACFSSSGSMYKQLIVSMSSCLYRTSDD